MGKIRGTHSSPGIYTQITDLSYAANTLGITTLGLVGETIKGPAFEPIMISNYSDFLNVFGGTSAEKFKDTQYPKYELPYIAKSYLKASEQLYVCRVLGLSGYNAGRAFVITAENESGKSKHVVAVLRSRGSYKKFANIGDKCNSIPTYDTLEFDCDEVELKPYNSVSMEVNGCTKPKGSTEEEKFDISMSNYGKFTIVAKKNKNVVGTYPVTLNAGAKDYIYNVLGSKANDGSTAVFVEELYDLHLAELIENGEVKKISGEVTTINETVIDAVCDPVRDFVKIAQDNLKRSMIGQTFLCNEEGSYDNGFMYFNEGTGYTPNSGTIKTAEYDVEYTIKASKSGKIKIKYPKFIGNTKIEYTVSKNEATVSKEETFEKDETAKIKFIAIDGATTSGTTIGEVEYTLVEGTNFDEFMEIGQVYVVKTLLDKTTGKKLPKYFIAKNRQGTNVDKIGTVIEKDIDGVKYNTVQAVNVLSVDAFVCLDRVANPTVIPLSTMSDYHEQYRCASTPWIVSEIKGDGKNLQVKKLFRFHTISDGGCANELVKISIANIRPDEGTFDVLIRDFNDSDGNQVVLESYKSLTMVPGDPKYIGLQIGTLNGDYELRSKYVMVEIIENDMTQNCVPAGFLGYPVRNYGEDIKAPTFTYNTFYDEDIKDKKQYFGLSDIKGVDIDMLYYKGKDAYTENYTIGYTKGFHLDSTLDPEIQESLGTEVTVDGNKDMKVEWDAVSPNNVTLENIAPVIGSESDMEGTIYENVKLRKFTVYPYGGFDGWDIYRGSRTIGDEFKANKYRGKINNGYCSTFSKISDGTALGLTGNCITSDYYAFLAGANQFENPEKYVINLFATPGIDYVNQRSLSQEVLEMIEKRLDTLYVLTTPDKPAGASDAEEEMYSSVEVSDNLEDSAIDTYYAATYYPWIKYFDKDNNIYINLPATKDVLRNMADVDNKRYPWYAPAGLERGKVECKKMHFFAKLEDEDNVYDGRINPLKTFSKDGVKVWGNKTMYTGDTPMNRINVVRLMLYLRKLIIESVRGLVFDPNEATLKGEFESIIRPILTQIKKDRGITDFRLSVSQTPEQMDAHELSCKLFVKPTPTLEYIEIDFVVTPQGTSFDEI